MQNSSSFSILLVLIFNEVDMKKSLLYFLITVGVIAIAALIFYVVSPNNNLNTDTTTNQNTNTVENGFANSNSDDADVNAVSDGGMQPGLTYRVSAISDAFIPETVTISAGDLVTWKNDSQNTVYIAPDTHPSHLDYAGVWDDDGTGRIAPGEEYTFTFTESGTYTYHDHLNASSTGTVIVE